MIIILIIIINLHLVVQRLGVLQPRLGDLLLLVQHLPPQVVDVHLRVLKGIDLADLGYYQATNIVKTSDREQEEWWTCVRSIPSVLVHE